MGAATRPKVEGTSAKRTASHGLTSDVVKGAFGFCSFSYCQPIIHHRANGGQANCTYTGPGRGLAGGVLSYFVAPGVALLGRHKTGAWWHISLLQKNLPSSRSIRYMSPVSYAT